MYLLATALGLFFAISGWHKLTNEARHNALLGTLTADLPKVGIPVRFVPFMSAWLPLWELSAGAAALMGVALNLPEVVKVAMLPIIAIMTVALLCEGRARITAYAPIDRADWLDDALYLPETVYLLMAVAVVLL